MIKLCTLKGEELTCMMIEINLYKSAEFEDKKEEHRSNDSNDS